MGERGKGRAGEGERERESGREAPHIEGSYIPSFVSLAKITIREAKIVQVARWLRDGFQAGILTLP